VGAAAGIIVGVITVGIVVTTKANMANLMPWAPPEVKDINAGFIALTLNVVVTILVSLFSRTLQPSVAKRLI
jgi:SSS family solute:Na+ symporter